MNIIRNYLLDEVKEQGIVDMILDMKYSMERKERVENLNKELKEVYLHECFMKGQQYYFVII